MHRTVGLCEKSSVTRKKLPNVHKSCLKLISLEKWYILTTLQKLLKNVEDLNKLIVAKGFKKVAQSPINRPIWSHCLRVFKIGLDTVKKPKLPPVRTFEWDYYHSYYQLLLLPIFRWNLILCLVWQCFTTVGQISRGLRFMIATDATAEESHITYSAVWPEWAI